ncbi:hypothetical protein PMAYCL1PPCAC_15646, partial [Pristionchus mayeri]
LQIWRKAVFCAVMLCVLLAFAPVWFLFDYQTSFERKGNTSAVKDDDFVYYVVSARPTSRKGSVWLNMVIVSLVCTVISSLLYCACAVRLWTCSVTKNRKLERNFFLVGLFSMIFSLPYMTTMIVFCINLSNTRTLNRGIMSFFTFQLPWLTDLKYLSPAPMLLITNMSIRQRLMNIFFPTTTAEPFGSGIRRT